MDVDVFKRNFASHKQAKHDHARYPWVQDVATGFHQANRVKVLKIFAVRIVERGIRPAGTTKPRVKHIGITAIGFFANGYSFLVHSLVINPVIRVINILEGRDRNTPGNLSADVPVAQAFQIRNKLVFFGLRIKGNFAGMQSL